MTGSRPDRLICVGFRRWKQYNLAPILRSQAAKLIFVADASALARLSPSPADLIGWWSASPPEGVAEIAEQSGAGTVRIEDGFIRSVGLGSDLIPPHSLVLDRTGIYFDPRTPSDLENILNSDDFSDDLLARAQAARDYIVEHRLTKYNLEPHQNAEWPTGGRKVVLVTGQVEDDASIRFGCTDVKSNSGLLRAARESNPGGFIVYKPHPDVMSGNRRGKLALAEAHQWADHIETDLSVISCIEASDELHCMTSLAGFDALLRGKHVVTYGQPFYAGWGLTEDRVKTGTALSRRQRILALNELIAGTLICYPVYWDVTNQNQTQLEPTLRAITLIREELEKNGALRRLKAGFINRQVRKIQTLWRAFSTNIQ